MREAAARRYTRLLNETSVLPDLILIDGGIGQVNAVKEVLDSLELDYVPVLGLAKKNEEIFLPHCSKPVIIPEGSAPLKVLQAVRDEAHRFATTFNKQLRKKEVGFTVLESIPGIGSRRSKMLMSRFGSVQGILNGSEDEIAAAAKISCELAGEVKKFLSTKKF
jgi:excinuclease ABC subunit C